MLVAIKLAFHFCRSGKPDENVVQSSFTINWFREGIKRTFTFYSANNINIRCILWFKALSVHNPCFWFFKRLLVSDTGVWICSLHKFCWSKKGIHRLFLLYLLNYEFAMLQLPIKKFRAKVRNYCFYLFIYLTDLLQPVAAQAQFSNIQRSNKRLFD